MYCGFWTSCNAGIQTVMRRQSIRLLAHVKTHMQCANCSTSHAEFLQFETKHCDWLSMHDGLNTRIARDSTEQRYINSIVHTWMLRSCAGNQTCLGPAPQRHCQDSLLTHPQSLPSPIPPGGERGAKTPALLSSEQLWERWTPRPSECQTRSSSSDQRENALTLLWCWWWIVKVALFPST